jgi:hypothetical protein
VLPSARPPHHRPRRHDERREHAKTMGIPRAPQHAPGPARHRWKWDDERIVSLLATVTRGYPLGVVMTLQTALA